MSPNTHQSEGSDTLPAPELNPLLNPVLGQNMGRWAEVYFTSPPEKREQAVLDLLRELQGEPVGASSQSSQVQSPQVPSSQVQSPQIQSSEVKSEVKSTQAANAKPRLMRCRWCGRDNPASHKFCGMCGKPVEEPGATARVHIADLHVTDEEIADNFDRGGLAPVQSLDAGGWPERSRSRLVSTEDRYEPASNRSDETFFRHDHEIESRKFDDEIFHYPPASHSYGYLGIILVIAIFAIAFFVWRNSHSAQNAQVASPAPAGSEQPKPEDAAPPIAQPPEPTTAEASKPNTPDLAPSPRPHTPEASSDARNARANALVNRRKSAHAGPAAAAPTGENPPASASTGDGSEELATAQRYLSGPAGQQRDRAEAAKWLWKAVGKHNADATLLLADLYMKGEGVAKNCDQARVLLDSAARRGIRGAGEQLRHLQAFGCQ